MRFTIAFFFALNCWLGINFIKYLERTEVTNMRTLKTTVLALGLSVAFCFSAFATEGASSLEELQQQAQETTVAVEETVPATAAPSQGSNNSYSQMDNDSAIANIANAAKLDGNTPEAEKVGNIMNSWGAKIMQVLGYVISIGICIGIALDTCFIAIPPLRGILANGYIGTADQRSDFQQNNTMSGMGGVGMGRSGFGGGFNGMQQDRMNMQATNNNQPATGRIQLVSNAALNATAAASTGDSPYKIYFKQQLPTIIVAPILFVLAATGILAQVGFFIGNYLTNWIGSLI